MLRWNDAPPLSDHYYGQQSHYRRVILASQCGPIPLSPRAPAKPFAFILPDQLSSPLVVSPIYHHLRPTLPIELYRLIATYITNTHDLSTLSRVSKSWQRESECVLYYTLTLRRPLDITWRSQSFLSRPSLSLYVRKLSITLNQYIPLKYVSRILAGCTRLYVLYVRGLVWADYSCVLDSIPPGTLLREFGCCTRGEAGIVRFLSRQPELEQLDLSAHAFELDALPPDALPKLKVFSGWLATAAALARGRTGQCRPRRPLGRLTLKDDSPDREVRRFLGQLGQQVGASIVALDLRISVLRLPIAWSALESVFLSLGSLRFLGVCGLECTTNPMFTHLISQLLDLRAIVFGAGYAKYDEGVQRRLVQDLGDTCPALTHVVIRFTNWCNDWVWTRDRRSKGRDDPRPAWLLGLVSRRPVTLEELARICDDDEVGGRMSQRNP